MREETTPTQGTLRAANGRLLPLKQTDVKAEISGPVATVRVTQVFINDGELPIEAVYSFPLPGEASVFEMAFRIEDRVVRAVVKEKREARRDYARARSEGKAATLLEEDTPSLFTLSVANVAPGARVEVEMVYQEVLAFDDGQWRFVFPMVAPPRYREGEAPAANTPIAPPRMPTGERSSDVTMEVSLRSHGELEMLQCPSHATHIEVGGDSDARIVLDGEAEIKNRDFVLTWRAGGSGVRPRVFFEREAGRRGTFLLMLTPSTKAPTAASGAGEMKAVRCGNCGAAVTDLSAIQEVPGLGTVVPCSYCGAILTPGTEVSARASTPRDVLILVDRSASMRGTGSQARQALRMLLTNLPQTDAVQIIAFDHERTPFDGAGERFLALSPELIARADAFMASLVPRGGTELEAALGVGSKMPTRDGRTRAVVLITDAAIGNEGRLLRRLPALIGSSARLFVLGLGATVDRRLIDRLARAGGGASDVLLPGEDAALVLERFSRRVRQCGPVLTGVSLWWEGADTLHQYPASVPDLYGGEPVQVLGRFGGQGPSKLVITGAMADGKPFRQELAVVLPESSDETPGLTRLWARRRVSALSEADEQEDEALALSLEHAIVGPHTALVAVDSKVSVEKTRHKRGRLVVTEGATKGQIFEIARDRFTMGRHGDCDLTMVDSAVSRVHAEIVLGDDGAWQLRDLDSMNGTLVGSRSIRSMALEDGTVFKVGGTTMRFEIVDEPEAHFEVLPTRRVDVPMAAAESDSAPPRHTGAFFSPPGGGAPMPPPPAGAPIAARRAMSAPPPPSRAPAAPMAPPPPSMMRAPRRPSPAMSPPAPRGRRSPRPPGGPAQQGFSPPPQSPIEAPGSDPYPERELLWLHKRGRGALDLLFLVDATGSMGAYIEEVRTRLLELVDALKASPLCSSLRLGLVSYRDHPPQEHTYITRTEPLTEDIDKIRGEVLSLSAHGGGDGPEAVADGLFEVVRFDWRREAARAVVWFGDAPPHGVEPHGDSFPEGCPAGHHWYTQAESCREMGVAVYAIGCLPGLRAYKGAEAVFRQVARVSRGMFLLLREAHMLVPLIAGAAVTELDRQRIDERVADVVSSWQAPLTSTDEAERVRWLTEVLRGQGVRPRSMVNGGGQSAAPMRFRDLEPGDVASALDRLRLAGRVGF